MLESLGNVSLSFPQGRLPAYFRYLPLRLFPSTVPHRTVVTRPVDCVTWPYHLRFLFFTRVDLLRLKGGGDGVTDPVCDPTFCSWWFGGRCKPPGGARKQKQFGNNLLKFGLKSGLWIAVYTHNSGAKKRFKNRRR